MTKIKNILVPVDGSEISNRSLDYAKEMAEKFHADITLLHVYELPIPMTGYEYGADTFIDIEEDLIKYSHQILDKSEKYLAKPGLKIKKLVLMGDQGMQIVDAAEKNNYDLIIMGSRGLGSIKGFLLGSVSNYVTHHSKIPVFLVH